MALPDLILLLVPLLQQPGSGPAPGEVGKFRWPPVAAKTIYYEATLTKERKLSTAVAKAEKAARKAAKLYVPSRSPKQRVEISMGIELTVDARDIKATYTTKLRKQSLRMNVLRPKTIRTGIKNASTGVAPAVPFLGNDRISSVWGLPPEKGHRGVDVPLGALDRRFTQKFKRASRKGVIPEDLRAHYGDHLLPVVWTFPLPCWIGSMVATLDLSGEAVIGGKQLLRDATQYVKLGHRETRAEGMWTKASSSGFTLKYKIDVEQMVAQQRDGKPLEAETTRWLFHIEGLATYSFREQAWDSIVETVTGKPKNLSAEKLRALHDEVFLGTIKIRRVEGPGKGKRKPGKRGKRGSRRRR
jgi:hypothetical protein